tara:strand:+ start:208 stop:843 length:636 start_codon:yes stop_codon:yes gene_type:complete
MFNNIHGTINRNTTGGWGGYNNEFLKFLYNQVLNYKPKTIIEFGTGWGYTTIALAQGLRDVDGGGIVKTYDYYSQDDYAPISGMVPWKHTIQAVENNLEMFGVDKFVEINNIDIFDWFKNPIDFDLAFIDIHNEGDKLNKIFNDPGIKNSVENGAQVFFCGGSVLRDEINVSRNETPITSVDCDIECVFGGTSDENIKGKKSCIAKIKGYK